MALRGMTRVSMIFVWAGAGFALGCSGSSGGSSSSGAASTLGSATASSGSHGSTGSAAASTATSSGSTSASSGHSASSSSGHASTAAGTSSGVSSSGASMSSTSTATTTSSTGGTSGVVGGVPGGIAGVGTMIGTCSIFPNDNPWNVEVDGPNVQVISTYDTKLAQSTALHADFGDFSTDGYGIPFTSVPASQPDIDTEFALYASESDPGPGGWIGQDPVANNLDMGETQYPFAIGMPIEGNPAAGGMAGDLPGDQHALALQQGTNGCTSYEAWNCVVASTLPFTCANGAVFDLTSNALRPAGFTSADLAGMSILAGLVRLSEVQAGTITHAVRVTFNNTQSGYIPPATHAASPGSSSAKGPAGSAYPPMGLRLRLKAGTPITGFSAPSQVIMTAMKKYGLIVADIGSDWFFQGDSDDGWNGMAPDGQDTFIAEILGDFHQLHGSDFEAVYSGDPVDTNL